MVWAKKKPVSRVEANNGLKTFDLSGKTIKDSQYSELCQQYPKLWTLLDACPVLAFTATGVTNICRRFNIDAATLELCITAFLSENLEQSRSDWKISDLAQVKKATPELLATIGKAVASKRKYAAKKKSVTLKKAKEGQKQC